MRLSAIRRSDTHQLIGFGLALAGLLALTPPAHAHPLTDNPIAAAHRAITAEISALLESDRPADVAEGLRALQGVPAPGLEGALATAAAHPMAELSGAALELLAQTGSAKALPLIEAALRSGDPGRISVASVWLPRFGDAGLDVAARVVDARQPMARHAVLASLAHFPASPKAKALLERASHRADSRTARVAAFALADADD